MATLCWRKSYGFKAYACICLVEFTVLHQFVFQIIGLNSQETTLTTRIPIYVDFGNKKKGIFALCNDMHSLQLLNSRIISTDLKWNYISFLNETLDGRHLIVTHNFMIFNN